MKVTAGILVVVLAQGLAGCNSDSSPLLTFPFRVVPSPAATAPVPVPIPVGQERWNLAGTYLGHSGPQACIQPFDGSVSTPTESVLMIRRSGESIELWTDHDHYVGTVLGDEFSTSNRGDESQETWPCGERGRLHYRTEGYASGRFSGDGRALTGEEVALFRLESGETITRRWGWSARQSEKLVVGAGRE